MSNLYITTTQNIKLFFRTATIGERMLAYGIDLFVKIAYIVFIFYVIPSLFPDLKYRIYYDKSIYVLVFLFSLPVFFYTLIFESLLEGQTLGKKLLKIKVVKVDGFQAAFSDYLLRWIFRLVDVDFAYIPGVVSMISNKYSKRLGDLAAGTAVITEKLKYDISHTILMDVEDAYKPRFQQNQIMLFSDNDMRIIKENAEIAFKQKNIALQQKLVRKIESVMEISNPFSSEYEFVKILLKDYNYYTGKTD
ncbi:MAG: RDD family protein [Paludibacter sp.]|nr:RDD family protein [Paludibacter sp.]